DRPTLFGTRSGMALAGEAGSEGILPLARTSDGNLGVHAVGGVQINIIDQRSHKGATPVEVQQGQGPDGQQQLNIFIRDTVMDLIDSGKLDSRMRNRFGLGRSGTR